MGVGLTLGRLALPLPLPLTLTPAVCVYLDVGDSGLGGGGLVGAPAVSRKAGRPSVRFFVLSYMPLVRFRQEATRPVDVLRRRRWVASAADVWRAHLSLS